MNVEREIIELLQRDASISHKNIAAMMGTDEQTVDRIVSELTASGTILKYIAVVNPEKLDHEFAEAEIELKVSPQRNFGYDDIARRVYKFPEVKDVYLMSGPYDLLVRVESNTMKNISKFVWEKLAVMEGVTSTVTLFIMRKYKDNGVILVDDEREERLVITP